MTRPLSEAQHRQRVEAARARWRKAAGARLLEARERKETVVYRGAPRPDPAPRPRSFDAVYVTPRKKFARDYGQGGWMNAYALPRDTSLVDLGAGARDITTRTPGEAGKRFMRREQGALAAHLASPGERRAAMRDGLAGDPEVQGVTRYGDGANWDSHTQHYEWSTRALRGLKAQGTSFEHDDGRAGGMPVRSIALADTAGLRFLYARAENEQRSLRLRKREKGAPLSEAELRQRREAAKRRWAGHAAAGAATAAVGAGVLGAAEHHFTLKDARARAEAVLRAGPIEAAKLRDKAERRAGRFLQQADARVADTRKNIVAQLPAWLDRRIRETSADIERIDGRRPGTPPAYRNVFGEYGEITPAEMPKDVWRDELLGQRSGFRDLKQRLADRERTKLVPVVGHEKPGAREHVRWQRGEVRAGDLELAQQALKDPLGNLLSAPAAAVEDLGPGDVMEGLGPNKVETLTPAQARAMKAAKNARAAARRAAGLARGPVDLTALPEHERARVQKALDLLDLVREDTEAGYSWSDRKARSKITQASNLLAVYGLGPLAAVHGKDIAEVEEPGRGKKHAKGRGKVPASGEVMLRPVQVGPGAPTQVDGHMRRIRPEWPTAEDRSGWRAQVAEDATQRGQWLAARVKRQGAGKAEAVEAAARDEGTRLLRDAPAVARRAGLRGAAMGAGIGALGYAAWQAGRWAADRLRRPVEKLAKAAADDAPDPERSTALSLGEAFKQWLAAPTEVGTPESLAAAESTLKEAFAAAAGAALPPEVSIGAHRGGGRRRLAFDLDARNPDVERQARMFAADKVSRIAQEARDAIRAVIVRGTEEGLDIPTQARLIREAIGLTPQQAAWVQNYRRELEDGMFALARNRVLRDRRHDRVLDRLAQAGERPSADQVDRMAASYHRRILAFRATTIARTEALAATNLGQLAGTRAFLEENPDATVIKRWIATDDDRVRDDHWQLHGKEVEGLDTAFLVTPKDGTAPYEIRFPHDPLAPAHSTINCRCSWSVRIVRQGQPRTLVAEAVEA